MEREFLEAQLAAGRSLEQIGRLVGKHPSTVGYWLKKHGLVAAHHAEYAPRGGITRERLAELVELGLTTRAIAAECSVGYSTVRYWLKRHGLETLRTRREPARDRPRHVARECPKHGAVNFVLESRGYYRCTRCRAERVSHRRRKVKEILVAEAGGGCVACGFNAHQAALAFHHLDPSQKRFNLSLRGVTRSIDKLRAEARKCVLLCATCHAMVEAGVLSV